MQQSKNISEYEYNKNKIIVESHFGDDVYLENILKNCVREEKNKNTLHRTTKKCYNGKNNTTVVSSLERRN